MVKKYQGMVGTITTWEEGESWEDFRKRGLEQHQNDKEKVGIENDEYLMGHVAPVGASAPVRIPRGYISLPQTALMVREESRLLKVMVSPLIQLRAGLFIVDNVAFVDVMLSIEGGKYSLLSESSWNYHMEDTKLMFQDMAVQEDIGIHFYGDSGEREKSLLVKNPLRDFFKDAIEKIESMPPWEPQEDFDAAKEKFMRLNPAPLALWKTMSENPSPILLE